LELAGVVFRVKSVAELAQREGYRRGDRAEGDLVWLADVHEEDVLGGQQEILPSQTIARSSLKAWISISMSITTSAPRGH
jgi:hypothetical protein